MYQKGEASKGPTRTNGFALIASEKFTLGQGASIRGSLNKKKSYVNKFFFETSFIFEKKKLWTE